MEVEVGGVVGRGGVRRWGEEERDAGGFRNRRPTGLREMERGTGGVGGLVVGRGRQCIAIVGGNIACGAANRMADTGIFVARGVMSHHHGVWDGDDPLGNHPDLVVHEKGVSTVRAGAGSRLFPTSCFGPPWEVLGGGVVVWWGGGVGGWSEKGSEEEVNILTPVW